MGFMGFSHRLGKFDFSGVRGIVYIKKKKKKKINNYVKYIGKYSLKMGKFGNKA